MKNDKGLPILSSMKSCQAYTQVEFSGTLLGFDDYVSKCDASQYTRSQVSNTR
jgi:hypothetical protein